MIRTIGPLTALTLVRLWLAASTPLTPDETYYFVWSRALAAGYLDHPPMVALWIRAGTILAGPDPLGVRLLGPLSAALGSILLYDAAERLFPARHSGLTAAVLFNATLASAVGSVIMTPDTPLLLFWTATLWAGARVASGGSPAWWLAAGGFAGLALVSKYTAAFLPLGLGLFALIAVPRWFRRPEPWLGALLAGLLFLPVVIWNAEHDWAGMARQGGRIADWRPERAPEFLAELVGGQIGLATPGIFVLFVAGIAISIRITTRTRDPRWSLLAAVSLPATLVFLQHALGDRVQGNWPVILYPGAALAAAGMIASGAASAAWRRLIWPSAALGFTLTAGVYGHVLTGWPTFSGARDPVVRQLLGWDDLAARAEASRQSAGAAFIAAEPFALAAQLSWALPRTEVLGAGDHWTSMTLAQGGSGQQIGILIRPERYGDPKPGEWREATRLANLERASGATEIERYAVFQVRAGDGRTAGAILPHR